jgi:hypothetical protein
VVGPKLLREIKKNLKAAQDRQKSYTDKGRIHKEFKLGDHVFLKVKANKSSLKLAYRYCGPFKILERIGPVAYILALPTSMSIHNLLYVSFLKKYVLDANYVIDWNVIQVEQEGAFQVNPVRILDRKVKQL